MVYQQVIFNTQSLSEVVSHLIIIFHISFYLPSFPPCISDQYFVLHAVKIFISELQQRSSNIQCSLKSLLLVGNLYQTTTTLSQEPVSIIHFTRPGTCINRTLHLAWIQYQAAHPKLISYTMPCKLACRLP